MPDKFSAEVRSHIMSHIRSKNTKLELMVFKELRRRKIYFQKHYKGVVGTPDIAIPSRKIAIFIDGDFWHGYRFPVRKKRINSGFWINKIERNRARDKRTFAKLRRMGWKVLRIWEHEIKKNSNKCFAKVVEILK